MNNRELKINLINEIERNCQPFKKVSIIRYRMRCPFCGDKQDDPKDMHLYLKCDLDNPNEPILYNCFLANCGAKGKVDREFMERIGVKSKYIKEMKNQRYSKIKSIKNSNIEIITGTPIIDSPQIRYIEKRLGKGLSIEDYDKFKIVWNIENLFQYISDQKTKNTLPSNDYTISFLSDDKSTLLTRGFEKDDPWKKTPLFSLDNRIFYTIKNTFNLFTIEDIYVNIAEGLFDILSVYKNFNTGINSAYIATLGSDYIGAIDFAIIKGLIGSNVIIRIYLDSNIKPERIKYLLKRYKYFFKKIYLYECVSVLFCFVFCFVLFCFFICVCLVHLIRY